MDAPTTGVGMLVEPVRVDVGRLSAATVTDGPDFGVAPPTAPRSSEVVALGAFEEHVGGAGEYLGSGAVAVVGGEVVHADRRAERE